ncbi:hypothetical protein M9H77_25168 [Catharanthus roseus]|uniref:Uncharacterized protein n=1 Tax=Catharanthus roseus TaxID=4058 RepID=A0ACC0A7Z5_CATRO|nr:hypothetical protein M9H77_25168 [Catharanthus roseus]
MGYTGSAKKIYNVVAKIKKNRMQVRNTIEEVLCLSAQRGYTVFYKNYEDNNVLSDIVFAYPTSIEMMRTWSYVLIMDTHIKQTKKVQSATVGSGRNDPDWKSNVLKTKWQSKPDFLHYLFTTWLNPFVHKFVRYWTKRVMHFGVETTNQAESEYSVLKLWLSTCPGDLEIVFLNIDSLIEGQIADIKASL